MENRSPLIERIAKAIYEDDLKMKVSFQWKTWDSLPHHKKINYEVQAERMIRVIKKVVKK